MEGKMLVSNQKIKAEQAAKVSFWWKKFKSKIATAFQVTVLLVPV